MNVLSKNLQLIVIVFVTSIMISKNATAQKSVEHCCITQNELVGIWQEKSETLGSGLMQNFHFFSDGTFILNLGDDGDDARTLTQIKGKYRLNADSLHFTIFSRTIVEGEIGISDMTSLSIFSIQNGKIRELQESDPKEINAPCYVTTYSRVKIKLNNELYYKIKQ